MEDEDIYPYDDFEEYNRNEADDYRTEFYECPDIPDCDEDLDEIA